MQATDLPGRPQPYPVLAAAAAIAALAATPTASFAEDRPTFRDFPMVIYCEYEGIGHAYYFARLGLDGVAIYLTPDRLAGTITVDDVAKRIGGEQTGTCGGRTIDDLTSAGQAFGPD